MNQYLAVEIALNDTKLKSVAEIFCCGALNVKHPFVCQNSPFN